jgi:hypothetical protein
MCFALMCFGSVGTTLVLAQSRHDSVVETSEDDLSERFGENISKLFLCLDVDEDDHSILNLLSQVVIAKIDVLVLLVSSWPL